MSSLSQFQHATPPDSLRADPTVPTTPAGDTLRGTPDASPVATIGVPEAPPYGLEKYMLQQDKLYVVAAVLVVIWIGIALFIARTDRRISRLEKLADQRAAFDDASES
jgi:CcmD family protein